MTIAGRIWAPFARYRRQFALALIAIFVVAVGLELGGSLPRDVDVAYRFPAHEEVREARIAYYDSGEIVKEITLFWPNGAPSEVRDMVELSPGEYAVQVRLVDRAGETRQLRGRIEAPSEGVVRVALR